MTGVLSRVWDLYRGHFRVTMTRYMAYRLELVLWLVSFVLQPVVFMAVWQSAASQLGGQVQGFSREDLGAYFITVMLLNHLTMAWVMFEWDARVRKGELSYLLLRPHHIIHRDLGENITFKTATFPVMIITAFLLTLSFDFQYELKPLAVVAFIPAFLLAYGLRFLSDWTCALGSLYTERVEAINVLYFFIMLLFSGQMGPLQLLPGGVQQVASFLPFQWMLNFPTMLLMGRLTPAEIQTGMMMQVFWLAVLGGIATLLWRSGLKKYTAVGL